MSVNFAHLAADVFRVPLCDVLHAILTFKSSFEKLTIKSRTMNLIANIGADISRINLDVYEYNSDLDIPIPAIVNSTISLPPNTSHQAFVPMPFILKWLPKPKLPAKRL